MSFANLLDAGRVGTVASGVVVGGVYCAQVVAGAAIPTLMSVGSTVVVGVGSIMPWWIGPVQAFAVAGTLPVSLPLAAVAGGAAIATHYYCKSK